MLFNVEFMFSVIPIECALQNEYSFPLICSGLDIYWVMLEKKAGPLSLWRVLDYPMEKGNGNPTPVLLPGKSHGWGSLVGCSPWGLEESDMTERLHFHFSLSCIGEGNGNPLQCSCLENPRDREPGRLPSMGSHRVRHDWSDLAAAAAAVLIVMTDLRCR